MEREIELQVVEKLGNLAGQFQDVREHLVAIEHAAILHQNKVEASILNGLLGVSNKITDHEQKEEPRLRMIERLVWVAVGGVFIISGLIAFMWPSLQHSILK